MAYYVSLVNGVYKLIRFY